MKQGPSQITPIQNIKMKYPRRISHQPTLHQGIGTWGASLKSEGRLQEWNRHERQRAAQELSQTNSYLENRNRSPSFRMWKRSLGRCERINTALAGQVTSGKSFHCLCLSFPNYGSKDDCSSAIARMLYWLKVVQESTLSRFFPLSVCVTCDACVYMSTVCTLQLHFGEAS